MSDAAQSVPKLNLKQAVLTGVIAAAIPVIVMIAGIGRDQQRLTQVEEAVRTVKAEYVLPNTQKIGTLQLESVRYAGEVIALRVQLEEMSKKIDLIAEISKSNRATLKEIAK